MLFFSNNLQMTLKLFYIALEVTLKNIQKSEICTLGSEGTNINIWRILILDIISFIFLNVLQMALTMLPRALKVTLKNLQRIEKFPLDFEGSNIKILVTFNLVIISFFFLECFTNDPCIASQGF